MRKRDISQIQLVGLLERGQEIWVESEQAECGGRDHGGQAGSGRTDGADEAMGGQEGHREGLSDT